jgi:hypothetical protein
MEGQPPDDLDAPAMDAQLAQDVAAGAMASAPGALAAPIPSLAASDAMAMDGGRHRVGSGGLLACRPRRRASTRMYEHGCVWEQLLSIIS